MIRLLGCRCPPGLRGGVFDGPELDDVIRFGGRGRRTHLLLLRWQHGNAALMTEDDLHFTVLGAEELQHVLARGLGGGGHENGAKAV